MLRPVKDDQGLKTPGVYEIPCECGKVYIGQTGRTVRERISEHERGLRMQYFDKSAVAQHSLENIHHIVSGEVRLIDRETNYWDRLRREAIEIKLHPSNFNRDSGLHISKSWDPAISTPRWQRARGQHSTSAPVLTTPGVDQCTGSRERPLWLDSSRNTHRSISELIATIGIIAAYISRVFSYCTH